MAMGHFPRSKEEETWYSRKKVIMIKHSIELAFAMLQSVSLDSERSVGYGLLLLFLGGAGVLEIGGCEEAEEQNREEQGEGINRDAVVAVGIVGVVHSRCGKTSEQA